MNERIIDTKTASKVFSVKRFNNVVKLMRNYGVSGEKIHNRIFYTQEEIDRVKNLISVKHFSESFEPLLVFKGDKILHCQNVYVCKYVLKKKHGIDIPLERIKHMISTGEEYNGLYIELEA